MAWAPPAVGAQGSHSTWSRHHQRTALLVEAIAYVPAGAAVSASYQFGPHLSHRYEVYDWPNPFWASVWGNDDCDHLPDPRTIEYVILDRMQVGNNNLVLLEAMIEPGGPFEVIFQDETVIVAKRVGTSVAVDVRTQANSCQVLAIRHVAG